MPGRRGIEQNCVALNQAPLGRGDLDQKVQIGLANGLGTGNPHLNLALGGDLGDEDQAGQEIGARGAGLGELGLGGQNHLNRIQFLRSGAIKLDKTQEGFVEGREAADAAQPQCQGGDRQQDQGDGKGPFQSALNGHGSVTNLGPAGWRIPAGP